MRASMGLDRSNFVRYCITRYLNDAEAEQVSLTRKAAETRGEYHAEPRQKKV